MAVTLAVPATALARSVAPARRAGSGASAAPIRQSGRTSRSRSSLSWAWPNGPARRTASARSTPGWYASLAKAGARHLKSDFCVTIVDDQGHAIGHGCCKPIRGAKAPAAVPGPEPAGPDRATFIPAGKAGPDGGYGSWILALPGARYPLHRGHRPRPDLRLRPPVRVPGARPRRQAPPPGPGPRRHVLVPGLLPACSRVRLSSIASRSRRADAPVPATATHVAARATASSNPPDGAPLSPAQAGPAGPPWPAVPTR